MNKITIGIYHKFKTLFLILVDESKRYVMIEQEVEVYDMKKVELLSPVGNMDMLYQAIHNGADAVYLSGKNYGARKFAGNFTNEELVNAIQYAHLYDVKVYVTVNTMIYEEELDPILEYIEFLHQNRVDALIMQDIGLIQKVRTTFPNLEIHASTQCHSHNQDCLSLFHKLGLKRVVLAREMSLEEIKQITVPIEKEVFIHGALCVSYSGCCLFSSLNGTRSGNRGECVGSCRLPYKLIKNKEVIPTEGQYLLSTKELNTLDHLKELLDAQIDSLKIEGRMKSPAYVGYVTRLYRTLIDKYYQNQPLQLSDEELFNLKKLFNRTFTKGYLFNDKDIMNIHTPNHQGVEIGKVLSTTPQKIKIKLIQDDLNQNDGIRFQNKNAGMRINHLYNQKGLLVNHVAKGEICYLENRFHIKQGDILLKTIDSKLIQELEKIIPKKIPVSMIFTAYQNQPLTLILTDQKNTITVIGPTPEIALKRATTQEEIQHQLSKLGSTPFTLENLTLHTSPQLFINIKIINELRREAVEKLIIARKQSPSNLLKNKTEDILPTFPIENTYHIHALVRTEEQLKVCLKHRISDIYLTDYSLYKVYQHLPNIYYRLPRVNPTYRPHHHENLLVREFGSIEHYKTDNTLIGDYTLNTSNHYSVDTLNKLGLNRITLSVELNNTQIQNIMKTNYPVEVILYGRLELMTMKYCPLKKNLNYCTQCQQKNHSDKFYLEDKANNRYPITHENCLTQIMHHKPIDKIAELQDLFNLGITNFRIELFEETTPEVENIFHQLNI